MFANNSMKCGQFFRETHKVLNKNKSISSMVLLDMWLLFLVFWDIPAEAHSTMEPPLGFCFVMALTEALTVQKALNRLV